MTRAAVEPPTPQQFPTHAARASGPLVSPLGPLLIGGVFTDDPRPPILDIPSPHPVP